MIIFLLKATGIRIATLVQSLFGLVAALVIAFIYGWKLAFVVLAGVPLMAVAGNFSLNFSYHICGKRFCPPVVAKMKFFEL